MGAFVILLFFAFITIISILGIILLIAGISLLIVYRVKKTPKKKKISIILIVSGIIFILPIAYISISNIFKNVEYKNEIKDTGVIIEIEDYNTKEIELNGSKYVRLNDYLDNVKELKLMTNIDKKAIANVNIIEKNTIENKDLLSIIGGFLFPKENDIYRLYSLGDNQDDNLIYSELGGIWCSTEYLNQAILYYDNIDNYQCFYINIANSSKTNISIDGETYDKILSVIEQAYTTTDKEIIPVSDDTFFVDICAKSKSGLLQFELKKDLLVNDGDVFCTTDRNFDDNGKEYYKGLKLPITY